MSIQQNFSMNNQHPVQTGSPAHLHASGLPNKPSKGSNRLSNQQLSNKVEAGCQADFPPDLITSSTSSKNRQLGNSSLIVCYDSDDDTMLKQRKSTSRSSSKGRKHRTGAYSKEDIRDQYCINQKELQAFEDLSRNRLFGCLSTGNLLNLNFSTSNLAHQPPSYLLNVTNGQRVQSKDSNRTIARYADISDREITDSETSSDYGCRNSLSFLSCMRKPVRIPKHYQRPFDPKLLQSDDDFGFKKLPIRPPRTCTVKTNQNKTASSISVMMAEQQIPQQFQTAYLHQSFQPNQSSLADYQGILRQSNFIDNLQNQLNNFAANNKGYASTSKSADELNDLDSEQQAANKTKHVSFELVRSNTISANLAQQVFNMQQTGQLPINERLINAEVAQLPNLQQSSYPFQSSFNQLNPYISLVPSNYANIVQLQKQPSTDQQTAVQLAHHLIAQQSVQQLAPGVQPPQPPVRAMHKKVTMKTQSTQTENRLFFTGTHQSSRSRSSSRSRFRDQQANLGGESDMLVEDAAYLIESIEPSECESFAMAVDHSTNKARRSSVELPAYLTLSPRSSRHRSKRKHGKESSASRRSSSSKQHQLLLSYQKLQNQFIEDSDDQLAEELNLLSKLSQLDREQRALKSGHYDHKSSHHVTPVANMTKSLLQNAKLSQQQQLTEATKQFHKNRVKLYRKSLGEVDFLSFEHDLSEPILPSSSVRQLNELNQTNLFLNNQLKQLNKLKPTSADLLSDEEPAVGNQLMIDGENVNRISDFDNYVDKLNLNLSPPEAFQDRVLIEKEKAAFAETNALTPVEMTKEQIIEEILTTGEEKPTKDERQSIQLLDDHDRISTTPNEESSIKQTTVIDQYDQHSKSERSSTTSTSMAEENFRVTDENIYGSASQLKKDIEEIDAEQKEVEKDQSCLKSLEERERMLEQAVDEVCLEKENELIKQLTEELKSPKKDSTDQLESIGLITNQISTEEDKETMKQKSNGDEFISQTTGKEVSIESLLTKQLADKDENELVCCKLIQRSDLEEVSEEDELDEEEDVRKIVDLTGGVYLRRNQSSELSTVSEVSEEISLGLNDETYETYSLKQQKSKESYVSSASKSSGKPTDTNSDLQTTKDESEKSIESSKSEKSAKSSKSDKIFKQKTSSKSSSSGPNVPAAHSESSSTTSNDVNIDELNDEESTKIEKTANTSSSSTTSFENLVISDTKDEEEFEKPEELSLSKGLSNDLNKKLEHIQLKSCEEEPKLLTDSTNSTQQKPPQSNLAQLKKCLDSDEFDPRIYRTFSMSIEEPFNLENVVEQETGKEDDDNQILEQIEDSGSINFSAVFGQTITLDKEVSLSEKSFDSKGSSKSSSKSSTSKGSSKNSSKSSSTSKASSKSHKSSKSFTSESSSISKTHTSKTSTSKKQAKSSPVSTSQTSTHDYKLLSGDTEENSVDSCSKCAELAAALNNCPLINLEIKEPSQELKPELGEVKQLAEMNNLLKSKQAIRSGLNVDQVEGASNDALAVQNLNLETAGESSQATEQDVANFSFEQQSSQDLADEDSLCLIQSIHATGSQPLSSSIATDNNKLSSTTKSNHSLQNAKLIGKKAIVEKKRQSDQFISSLRNGDNQSYQAPHDILLKTIESEECSNKADEGSHLEKYAVFDESSSMSETAGSDKTSSRVRNLLQRFENRPVSFAGESIELGRKERRRSSQSSGKMTIFAKQFGPKSQSIDLIVDDSLIGTNVSSSLKHSTSLEQQSTDEQCMEQESLGQSPELIKSSSKQSSISSRVGSAKSDGSLNKSEEALKNKRTSVEEYDESSQRKSIGDESISELISEISSTDTEKLKSEELYGQSTAKDSASLSEKSSSGSSPTTTKTGTTKESSEKKTTTTTDLQPTDLEVQRKDDTKASSDEIALSEQTDEVEIDRIDKPDIATASLTDNAAISSTTSTTTDYSDLKVKIREHDQALRQKQQLLQQQHSIKRKLLTQLSTSGLTAIEKEAGDEQTEKTVKNSNRMSSSQDDVLSIDDDEKSKVTGDKVHSLTTQREQDVKLSKQKSVDDSSAKDEEQKSTNEDQDSKRVKKSTIMNLPIYSKPGKLSKVNTLMIDELDEDIGIHSAPYTSSSWFFVTHEDELQVWGHKLEARKETTATQTTQSTDIGSSGTLKETTSDDRNLSVDRDLTKAKEDHSSQDLSTSFADDEERADLAGSTNSSEQIVSIAESERNFRRHFQSITHRMIHRRASMELYKRIMNNTFAIEKNVTISRVDNEFGFRIHGSKPVVVSAIEKDTAAEHCGLEIGDIIVSINDVNVLDFTHSDVVRLAHSGCLSLRLGCLNTSKVVRRILSSTSNSKISGTSNEQTLTVTTTCESQTTSSISVSNGERTRSSNSRNEHTTNDSNECVSDNEDEHTLSCRTVTCSSSIYTSSLDYNTASKVILTGYLRKSRAIDDDYHKIEEEKWRLRLFKLRIDGTLHWFQHSNQFVDPLGIISLKGTFCKLMDIDHIPKPIEQRNEPETKSVIFAILRNKDAKALHYFKCKSLETAQKWINLMNLISKQVTSINLYIEQTLKYTHTNPMYIRNADCCGYLGKKSVKTGIYKQRYFILKDACLYFNLEIASNAILGVFYLQGYKVQSSSDNTKKHCIQLVPTFPQHKLICLAADSEIDKKRWLSAFEYSIDRWIKLI